MNETYSIFEIEQNLAPVISWCIKNFGDPSDSKWFMSGDRFYFVQEKDATVFALRWTL